MATAYDVISDISRQQYQWSPAWGILLLPVLAIVFYQNFARTKTDHSRPAYLAFLLAVGLCVVVLVDFSRSYRFDRLRVDYRNQTTTIADGVVSNFISTDPNTWRFIVDEREFTIDALSGKCVRVVSSRPAL